jgi:preprotein translocase subunit SecD
MYYYGTGPIRGFAVVLAIGVCCSMFTAITVTRWLITVVTQSRLGNLRHLFRTGLG